MNFLNIQGPYAPPFYLDEKKSRVFAGDLEDLTQKKSLVISSKFRTDIFFQGNLLKHEEVIDLLNSYVSAKGYCKFFRSSGTEKSYTYYYYRLMLLQRMKTWLDKYEEKFTAACLENPKHPILHQIMELRLIFKENKEEHQMRGTTSMIESTIRKYMDLNELTKLSRFRN